MQSLAGVGNRVRGEATAVVTLRGWEACAFCRTGHTARTNTHRTLRHKTADCTDLTSCADNTARHATARRFPLPSPLPQKKPPLFPPPTHQPRTPTPDTGPGGGGVEGRERMGAEWWGPKPEKVGVRTVGALFAFFPLPRGEFRSVFSLSWGLLVELWPRFKAGQSVRLGVCGHFCTHGDGRVLPRPMCVLGHRAPIVLWVCVVRPSPPLPWVVLFVLFWPFMENSKVKNLLLNVFVLFFFSVFLFLTPFGDQFKSKNLILNVFVQFFSVFLLLNPLLVFSF